MSLYDPLREAPKSFDDWCASFDLDPREQTDDLTQVRTAAAQMLKNPVIRRVMAQLECNALRHLANCPLGDEPEAHRRLALVHAARSLPKALEMLAVDQAFDDARNQLKT